MELYGLFTIFTWVQDPRASGHTWFPHFPQAHGDWHWTVPLSSCFLIGTIEQRGALLAWLVPSLANQNLPHQCFCLPASSYLIHKNFPQAPDQEVWFERYSCFLTWLPCRNLSLLQRLACWCLHAVGLALDFRRNDMSEIWGNDTPRGSWWMELRDRHS